MEIRIKGEALDLGPSFGMEIEELNPLWNERGSQSLPASVPLTGRNVMISGGAHRADSGVNPNLPEGTAEVRDGAYMRRGTLNVTEASRRDGLTFNVGFDNSTAYQKWRGKTLRELGNLPKRRPEWEWGDGELLTEIRHIYQGYDRGRDETYPGWWDELAVFPLAIGKEEDDGKEFWELLNAPVVETRDLWTPEKVMRTLDRERTEVAVPAGYGVSPFVRAWKVLELVFEDLGLRLKRNPLRDDVELRRIVVLNNTADSICRGVLDYADLMPDCTVEDFLESLWVRFGLTFLTDFETGAVDFAFIRDLLRMEPGERLDGLAQEEETIRYLAPQYVRLTAGTSLEGAAPATARFEDYTKGMDTSGVKVGDQIGAWSYEGDGVWDRELYDGYIDGREDPDWEDRDQGDGDRDQDWDYDRDDGRDDDRDDDRDFYSASRSGSPAMKLNSGGESGNEGDTTGEQGDVILGRETVTGKWWKLDTMNGRTKESSTSFFDWDPRPEGIEALELSSPDECVPIGWVQKQREYEGDIYFGGYMPQMLTGARHHHSYIIGREDEEEKEDLPLAFMIAYTSGNMSVGRLTPERENGRRVELDDGTRPELTLYFQFADGLFARYWKDYDEILRHGNREVELTARIAKHRLRALELLRPVTLKGLRCLIDREAYSLPAGREIDVELTLRAIQTQGNYDIEAEQGIPNLKMGGY